MRIGCQIGMWRSDDTESVIAAMGNVGVDGIETFTTHLKPYYDQPRKFKTLLKAGRLRLSGAYFNSDGFVDPAAEQAVIAEAAGACRFLQAVGGDFLVVNGGIGKGQPARNFSDADFRQLAKVLNGIGAGAAACGVQAVVHPHVNCMVETPADVDRLAASGLDKSKVGLCVHASHQLLAGADAYEIYEKHASWVRYAHIGNSRDRKGCFLGEGVLDQQRLMRPLLEAGFDGWIIIECGKEGVLPEEYARNAVAYMKATWPQTGWES